MSVSNDDNKQFEIAKKELETAIRNCFTAFEKKLLSETIKRGIVKTKAKQQ